MTLAIFDYDAIIYSAGFAGEKRTVEATHIPSGRKKIFKNQTEFFGAKKKEIGGWLGKLNEERIAKGQEPFVKEDFTLETIRVADPIANVLHTVKSMINKALAAAGADKYVGYIGKGDSFRVERSTIYKYKGNREDAPRPLLKDEIVEYLIARHNAELVELVEADDMCVMMSIEQGVDNTVAIAEDKDSLGCPIRTLNPNKLEQGIIDGRCFGELTINDKRKVGGFGRKFFYFQVAYGDDVDNYRANSACDEDWGQVSAYNALNDATNDKEALQCLVNIYKHLYPEPKTIVGWRGDEIEVDWQYVFNENWDLARMLRHPNDKVVGTDVLKKFGLI